MPASYPTGALEEKLLAVIRDEIGAGTRPEDVAAALTRQLPGLVDRRAAQVGVMDAFDQANRDSDRALPFDTGPFERLDPE